MFEYKGDQYTLEELQASAMQQGYSDFDEFLQIYKNKGLKQISQIPLPSAANFGLMGDPLTPTPDSVPTFSGQLKSDEELNVAFYDYKANSKAYQRPLIDFFKLITDDSELPEIEETDRKKPSYFVAQRALAPYLGYNNVISNFFAEGISNMFRQGGVGVTQGRGTQAGWDAMNPKGEVVSLDEAKGIYEVAMRGQSQEQSDNVRKYQGRYEQVNEEHGGTMAFMVAVAENPMYIRDVAISSMASMATSLLTSEDVQKRAGVATTLGAVGGSYVPVIGTGLGGLSALMGSVSGSMDAGLSYQQFLQEQIETDGLDFTPENILKTLQDKEIITYKSPHGIMYDITGTRAEILKKRAIRRGIAIGFVDTTTGVLSGGIAKGSIGMGGRLTTRTQRAITGTTTAIGGGLVSEVAGQTFGLQEYDAGEILTEGFAEKGIAMTGVTVLPQLIKKKGKYSIHNEPMSESKFVNEINNMDDVTLAQANIKVENDPVLKKKLGERIDNAIRESQVDAKVYDKEDRKELVKKQRELEKAEADKKKDGTSYAVPGAAAKVERIKTEIEAIINKYAGVDGRKKDVRDRKKIKDLVAKARERIKVEDYKEALKGTEAFLGEAGKQLDINPYQAFNNTDSFAQGIVDFLMGQKKYTFDGKKFNTKGKSNEQIAEETQRIINSAKKGAGAVNLIDNKGNTTIYINREAAVKYRQLDVGSHEILHSVLRGALATMKIPARKKMIAEFKQEIANNLGSKVLDKINKRLTKAYTVKGKLTIDLDTTDEWFTALSDIIQDKNNNITYDNSKSFFDNIKNKVANLFNTQTDYENLSIKTGKDAFLFMKEYSKSVEKGKLSERMVAFAKGQKIPPKKKDAGAVFSKDAKQAVDKLGQVDRDGNNLREEGTGNFYYQAEADNVVKEIKEKGHLNALIRAQYKADIVPKDFVDDVITQLTPDIKNFKPEQNESLFGYLQGRIKFRAGDVYNKIYKKTEQEKQAKDVDDRTKEGEIKTQVAAETDAATEAFETEDLSITGQAKKKASDAKAVVQKESAFRKAIGIETGSKIYNEVLDGARKALLRAYEAGTSVRNIQRKLRDEANVYLFKTVKNFLGNKNYISNLKKFREPIMKVMFTSDLVQLERNVPQDERVFTRFVRKLTSKEDVQAAVDQKLLPPEALNIIDKGTAVSLYEKKNVSEASFMSFFDIPAFNPITGKRSGKRGTRKDQLAKYMAGALSYDATMQVAQETDVIQKRQELAELRNETLAEDNLETLAAEIGRDKNVKFSKSVLTEKQTKNVSLYLQNKINKLEGLPQNFISIIKELIDNGVGIIEAYETARAETGIDSAALDLIFKNGKFNNSHIDNIIYGIKKFGVAKVRNLGYDASINYLKNNIKGKSLKTKIKLINDFLVNIGRSTRSAKVYDITTNESLLANLIDVLDDQSIAENYRLVDAKIRGKKLQYKDTDTGSFKDVPLYENIENIKDNAYKSQSLRNKINEQAIKAREFISKIVFDKNLTKEEKNAIITLASFDQRGALRKSFDLGMHVNRDVLDLDSTKTILEHELTIKDTLNLIKDVINKNKSQEVLSDILNKSKVHILPKSLDNILNSENLKSKGSFERYQNKKFKDALQKLIDNGSIVNSNVQFSRSRERQTVGSAVKFSRSVNNPTKGVTVLDFDDTLATTQSLVKFTRPDGTTGTLNAEQYASTYENLLDQGYTFDFSEFNKVVKGKIAPLFQKALKLQNKFGSKNMFVLTARPPAAQKAIFDFLKANGLNIPLKNITGLGNSTAEAKALWIADKVGEGYNDFYFADDALQNVKAVKNMLDQFDVKSKVQQAKVKFSKSMNNDFNKILEEVTGIEAKKRFSDIKARKRGESKGKFRLFIPPSHEDFVGLLYNFMGKGRRGDQHRNFFEQALVRPLNRAYREIDTAKQAIANDYKSLNKQFPDVNKKLTKKTPDGDFTFQDAIRVYLWNKHGYDIPGLSKTDQTQLSELVMNDQQLQAYAETLNIISKQDTYVDPGPNWETGNIRIDLVDATGRVGRASYFTEFNENAEIIFSPENLNKIEAGYGKSVREALEDMLHRIKTGVNRPKGASAKPNMFMNWLNASVSGVMFFNTRSALLQQMSNVNYLNFADNNIFSAGLAFANQPQYWKDFAMIFNSDMLKQRRGGLQTDINGAELAEAIKKARPGNMFDQVAIITGKALRLGFLPTQIGDNIAIATGGAAFYRNRVNKYIKDGMSVKEAEAAAFTDFQNITQSTQQSARPDMTSQQQAMWIGKLVLNFLNTPSQYNRIIKKAGSDIINRRITKPNTTRLQSDMSNMSRILYYGAAQNLIFYGLQTALFAVMFGMEDDDEEKKAEQILKKKERVINGAIDTILRGSGIYGVGVSTLKNMVIKFLEQREKSYNKDESAVIMELANFSPVVGIKLRKIVNAEKTLNYNKKVIDEMETFDIDNPQWSAVTNYVEAITTAPVNRIYQKSINLRNAADNDYTALQRALFFSGYTTWSLNLGDTQKIKDIKQSVKDKKKKKKKKKNKRKSLIGGSLKGKSL